MYRSVLKGDTAPQPAESLLADHAGYFGNIGLRHLVRGVRQPVGEVAVVGQDQQAFAVGIQPAYVKQPLVLDRAGTTGLAVRRPAGSTSRSATVRRPSGSSIVATTPRGLFSTRYRCRRGGGMRAPSTRMTSRSGSTLLPCSRTISELTSTRPSLMSTSHARREAIPAAAKTFWRRTPSAGSVTGAAAGPAQRPAQQAWDRCGLSPPRPRQLAELGLQLLHLGQLWGKRRQVLQRLQAHSFQEVAGGGKQHRAGLRVMTGLLDQPAGQQSSHHSVDIDPSHGRHSAPERSAGYKQPPPASPRQPGRASTAAPPPHIG